jgi:hypothetical protein
MVWFVYLIRMRNSKAVIFIKYYRPNIDIFLPFLSRKRL